MSGLNSPFLSNFQVDVDESFVAAQYPVPDTITSVRKNEALKFYLFCNNLLE